MSDEKYVIFPEVYKRRELNAQYRAIPLKDTTSRLLRKYFNAMANLYGIIPLRKQRRSSFPSARSWSRRMSFCLCGNRSSRMRGLLHHAHR